MHWVGVASTPMSINKRAATSYEQKSKKAKTIDDATIDDVAMAISKLVRPRMVKLLYEREDYLNTLSELRVLKINDLRDQCEQQAKVDVAFQLKVMVAWRDQLQNKKNKMVIKQDGIKSRKLQDVEEKKNTEELHRLVCHINTALPGCEVPVLLDGDADRGHMIQHLRCKILTPSHTTIKKTETFRRKPRAVTKHRYELSLQVITSSSLWHSNNAAPTNAWMEPRVVMAPCISDEDCLSLTRVVSVMEKDYGSGSKFTMTLSHTWDYYNNNWNGIEGEVRIRGGVRLDTVAAMQRFGALLFGRSVSNKHSVIHSHFFAGFMYHNQMLQCIRSFCY